MWFWRQNTSRLPWLRSLEPCSWHSRSARHQLFLFFFMFVTALDVINKFSYMGFVINLIMSGISLKDNQCWELSSFSRPPPALPCLDRHVETPPRPALPNCHHSTSFTAHRSTSSIITYLSYCICMIGFYCNLRGTKSNTVREGYIQW